MALLWCLACGGDNDPIAYVDEDAPGRTPDFSRCGPNPSSDLDDQHMQYYCSDGGTFAVTDQPCSADDTGRTTRPLLRLRPRSEAAAW